MSASPPPAAPRPGALRRLRSAILRSRSLAVLSELALLPLLFLLARVSRRARRPIDVGLGPEPLINNVYHQRALRAAGYSAETFVLSTFYITREFDCDLSRHAVWARLPVGWRPLWLFVRSLFRYRALLIYGNGGPLGYSVLLRELEPRLYRLAGIRIVMTAYGSDVQDMSTSGDLYFRHAIAQDYPAQAKARRRLRANIDRWLTGADHVISGVEWVDYMAHWDTLLLGHFSIDTEQWAPAPDARPAGSGDAPLRVLHAPNHRAIKGTRAILDAVERLRAEGLALELVLLERVPNEQVREVMRGVDLVADQLVIGWYAMFALEAMALEKPVLCWLRPDLVDLYVKAGLVEPGEIPLIPASPLDVEARLRWAVEHREALAELGRRGRRYVERHHSLARIGAELSRILHTIGVAPRGAPEVSS